MFSQVFCEDPRVGVKRRNEMSIVELNNAAVSLMPNGCADSATRILERALKSLHRPCASQPFLPSAPIHGSMNLCRPAGHDKTASPQQRGAERTLSSHRSAPISTTCHSSCGCCTFLFQQALFVSADEPSLHLVGAVILYNLALIKHVHGVHTCNATKLMCAKKLYLLALDFVRRHCQEFGSKRALLVSLAIGNNLGDLYWKESHDVVEAKKCFCLVRETLRQLEAVSESERCTGKEYKYFALNAMIRLGADIFVATAA